MLQKRLNGQANTYSLALGEGRQTTLGSFSQRILDPFNFINPPFIEFSRLS
jgi:hypothetical protein